MKRTILGFLCTLLAFFAVSANASVQTNDKGFDKYGKMIFEVSKRTGVPAMDLIMTTSMESNFNTHAKNGEGTSAAGLNGFTDGTWRAMIKKHGKKYGVRPGTSQRNARASLYMTAEYMKENRRLLETVLKRKVDSTEVSLAHLLGPGGAIKLLKAKNNRIAYRAVGTSPSRNKRYFVKPNGKARTVAEFKAFARQVNAQHKSAYYEKAVTLAFVNQYNFRYERG